MGYTLPTTNISTFTERANKAHRMIFALLLAFLFSNQESKCYVLLTVFTISYFISQPDFLFDQEYRLLDMLVPIYLEVRLHNFSFFYSMEN